MSFNIYNSGSLGDSDPTAQEFVLPEVCGKFAFFHPPPSLSADRADSDEFFHAVFSEKTVTNSPQATSIPPAFLTTSQDEPLSLLETSLKPLHPTEFRTLDDKFCALEAFELEAKEVEPEARRKLCLEKCRERYRQLKEKGGPDYEAVLAKSRLQSSKWRRNFIEKYGQKGLTEYRRELYFKRKEKREKLE